MEVSANLLRSLINAGEKASNIARICRSNKDLLSLLVQEKSGAEANARFQHDFKTLADVLIQETIKHDIGELFPNIRDAIKGEESPSFTNKHGETVGIRIGPTVQDTTACLGAILQDEAYQEAAVALANEVHSNVQYAGAELGEIPDLPADLDYANLGIWIDPIDATAEYIAGCAKSTSLPEIAAAGLQCVTVLIGVYARDSGIPVMGVISQPFCESGGEADSYRSHIVWGVRLPQLKAHNIKAPSANSHRKPRCICSSSEQETLVNTLKEARYDIVFSAGAGYKALKVILHDADVYLLSKGSTFKWDTCAPQAILCALDGDMFDYQESIKQQAPITLKYIEKKADEVSDPKCNSGGIIAVRHIELLQNLMPHLITK